MPELITEVPRRVLAIYAHPDDPDVAAGGTVAAWAAAGCQVSVCICTDGGKGSPDPSLSTAQLVAMRREEVLAAGQVLGVIGHHWLDYPDGEVDEADLRRRLVELIRSVRPDAIVGADPTAVFFGQSYVNHLDHRVVGWATLDATSPGAANPRYFPDAGPAHRVGSLFLSGTLEPDAWVDISASIDAKAAALACHASQLGQPGEWLRTVVRQRAEDAGRLAGVPYAEGFRVVRLES